MTPAIRPQPQEASDSPPAPSAAHPGAQIAAGVIGSVAVTVAAKELGGSPWGTLVVALVGATVPVLISYTPRHRHLRLGIAAMIVAVAFALTYGGFALYDAAADKKTFPGPVEDPAPTATPTPDGGGSSSGNGGGEGRATVSPPLLRCTPDECGQVTVTSVGDEAIRVDDIRFTNDEPNGFEPDESCVGETIPPNEACPFDVDFQSPEPGTPTATLVVETSDGSTAPVRLEGTTINFGFSDFPTCELDLGVSEALLGYTLVGPDGGTAAVATSLSSPEARDVGDPISLTTTFDSPPAEVTFTIDPGDEVFETDEEDNEIAVDCV